MCMLSICSMPGPVPFQLHFSATFLMCEGAGVFEDKMIMMSTLECTVVDSINHIPSSWIPLPIPIWYPMYAVLGCIGNMSTAWWTLGFHLEEGVLLLLACSHVLVIWWVAQLGTGTSDWGCSPYDETAFLCLCHHGHHPHCWYAHSMQCIHLW